MQMEMETEGAMFERKKRMIDECSGKRVVVVFMTGDTLIGKKIVGSELFCAC
jgi:hypothetical protein